LAEGAGEKTGKKKMAKARIGESDAALAKQKE